MMPHHHAEDANASGLEQVGSAASFYAAFVNGLLNGPQTVVMIAGVGGTARIVERVGACNEQCRPVMTNRVWSRQNGHALAPQ